MKLTPDLRERLEKACDECKYSSAATMSRRMELLEKVAREAVAVLRAQTADIARVLLLCVLAITTAACDEEARQQWLANQPKAQCERMGGLAIRVPTNMGMSEYWDCRFPPEKRGGPRELETK